MRPSNPHHRQCHFLHAKMARKRKTTDEHAYATPPRDNGNIAAAKKQKIDWSTIDNFEGFTVSSVSVRPQKQTSNPATKKSKSNIEKYPGQDAPLDANVVQPNPFPETDLSEIHVRISPAAYWESTNRYRKFTINGEEFQVGQIVFVKKNEEENDTPDAIQHWLAKVLEVRAGDASHVYLRVFWAYRPEDLPGGRQPHHGTCELIISNHMDIIEAVTVQASASLVYWDDDPDSLALPADQLFYRQSFDVTKKTKPLSKLNPLCIDKQPCNPDELLVQCPHCSQWLHAKCLEKKAVQTAFAEHQNKQPQPPKSRGRPYKIARSSVGSSSTAALAFGAEVHASDAGKIRLTVTDKRKGQNKRQWDIDIACLLCNKIVEKMEPLAGSDNAIEEADNSEAPLTNGEADSVIGHPDADDDVAQKDMRVVLPEPELPVPVEIPRGRGRPPGSKNKKKLRYSSLGSAVSKKALQSQGYVKAEMKEEEALAEETTLAEKPALAHLANVTPVALPVHESVFQSGLRSVKKLLWGASW
ncbi:ebs-bah-phd domain-containing [Pyrenophora seminiperda CCB06]|uniref:Ebs-bah-phd domain-containing n=1 Tax=Pyrenophora seminiperda CCB06 TaxID=1302712 RepID=A0A3M7LX39_9PLEO|nr:ebs-bah-phd domain-containing [Pyrenophora seminiperda CCB06]